MALAGVRLPLPIEWRPYLLPLSAFAGALAVCFALDRTARWLAPGSIAALLLSGVALNATAASVIGLCTHAANEEQLRSLTFWLMGSLAGARWPLVGLLSLVVAAALWRALRLARRLNALALGEAAATHVGVDVGRLRSQAILLVALVCGFAVAWSGMITFLGLVAPHIARCLVGPDQRRLLPVAGLAGALLLLLADTLARTLAAPAEVPVGIFTALLGGPFFLALLRGAVRQQGGQA